MIGFNRMRYKPMANNELNQTNINGPNVRPERRHRRRIEEGEEEGRRDEPIFDVPHCWQRKREKMIRTVIGTTQRCRFGAFNAKPSTADRTDTAGVNAPSPERDNARVSSPPFRSVRTDQERGRENGDEVDQRLPPSTHRTASARQQGTESEDPT